MLLITIVDEGVEIIDRFGPDMAARLAIDQLRGNPHLLTGLAHAALYHVAHTEITTDILGDELLALVGEFYGLIYRVFE